MSNADIFLTVWFTIAVIAIVGSLCVILWPANSGGTSAAELEDELNRALYKIDRQIEADLRRPIDRDMRKEAPAKMAILRGVSCARCDGELRRWDQKYCTRCGWRFGGGGQQSDAGV